MVTGELAAARHMPDSVLIEQLSEGVDVALGEGIEASAGEVLVGALFGGATPLAAARFQLVVLVGLLAAESVAAVVLLRLLADVPVLPPGTAST